MTPDVFDAAPEFSEPILHLAPQALLRCAVALQYLSDFSKKARQKI
jgi:hypothetical protein